MMRAVDRDYTFWLAGYYDDFTNARAVADDLNVADVEGDAYDHAKTHHGGVWRGESFLNPRFRFSFPDRDQTAPYLSTDTLGASHLPSILIDATQKLKHNEGIHEWLTLDRTRDNESKWEGRAQLQYPCSIVANRQQFNRDASLDSYTAFCNGNDSSGTYYAWTGDTDSSDGRAWTFNMDGVFGSGSNKFRAACGVNQQADTSDTKRMLTSLAGTFIGERQTRYVNDKDYAIDNMFPITSPAGKPFLIMQLYSSTASTDTLLTYDGRLNCKGIEDTFTMRIAWHKNGDATITDYKLEIGFDDSDDALTINKSTLAFSRTVPAITLDFNMADLGAAPMRWYQWEEGMENVIDNDDIWYDIDVVMDYTTQRYTAYYNGLPLTGATAFGTKPTGGSWVPTDLHGWRLGVAYTLGSDGYLDLSTLIDRVGLVVPLSDVPDAVGTRTPIPDFKYTTRSNGISSVTLTLSDDGDDLTITPLVTGNALSEWWLLAFRDNINRPFWRGPIERVSHKQDSAEQTLDITISATDALSLLGRQIPVWEVGQGTGKTMTRLSTVGDSIEKRVNEVTGMKNAMRFGTAKLNMTNATIGYDIVRFSAYNEVSNQRTSLYSGHPIQMYVNEDDAGPNSIEHEWDGGGSSTYASTYKLQDILFLRVTNVGGSDYLELYHTSEAFSVSDVLTVKGTTVDAANHTVDTINSSLTNAIPNLKLTTIIDGGTPFSAGYAAEEYSWTSFEDVDAVGQNAGPAIVEATLLSGTHTIAVGDVLTNIGRITAVGGTDVWLLGEAITVTAVPSNTKIHFEADNWPYNAAVASQSSGHLTAAPASGRATHWGAASNHITTEVPAVVYRTTYDTIATAANYALVENRSNHSRWIRDLAKSAWFKAQFGIIHSNPTYSTGKYTGLWKPVSAPTATARSWAANATWVGPAAFTQAATSIVIDEPGIFHSFPRDGSTAILDVINPDTRQHDVVFATSISTPSSKTSTYNLATNDFTMSNHGLAIYDIVVHEGFNNVRLNGIFQVCEVATSSRYDAVRLADIPFGAYDRSPPTPHLARFGRELDPDPITANWYTNLGYVMDSLPLADTYRTAPEPDYRTPTNADGGKAYYGSVTISGVSGQTRDWEAGSIIRHRQVDESNGYKHLWVLWSDMRNSGEGDADGGYRKNNFGLVFPTTDNYEIGLVFSNQLDENGDLDEYASLKVGDDCDIWQFDAEKEPLTQAAWSAARDASDAEDLDTRYGSWASKGGAFCVIDCSPFWNLNTLANGGRPGYFSGGRVDLGDYDTEHHGFPFLVDSYWREGTSSYKNTNAAIAHHENSLNWINDGTAITREVSAGDPRLYIRDNSQFDSNGGYGVILLERGEGRNLEREIFYHHWGTTGSSPTAGDFLGASSGNDVSYIKNYWQETAGPASIRTLLDSDSAVWLTGSQVNLKVRDSATQLPVEGWDRMTVYNTPAALYALRLLMTVKGEVETPNIGSYFEHDKIRFLLNVCLQDSWMRNGTLSCMADINNVPISENMTLTGIDHNPDYLGVGLGDTDSFGSVNNMQSATILSAIQIAQGASGYGRDNAQSKTWTYLMGPDNRIDYRPTYALNGYTFNRTTLKFSDMSSNLAGQVTSVRVYYNEGLSFIDHPTPAEGSNRFKVIHLNGVKTKTEALSFAREEYSKVLKGKTSVNAEIIRSSSLGNIMTEGARHGYISDTCVRTLPIEQDDGLALAPAGFGKVGASWWTARFGGCWHPGMVNALDGRGGSSSASTTLFKPVVDRDRGTVGAMDAIDGIYISSSEGFTLGTSDGYLSLVTTGGGSSQALTWHPWPGSFATTAGYNVAAGGWFVFSVTDSGNTYKLSVYVNVSELPTVNATYRMDLWHHASLDNTEWLYWYGENSVSHAIQMVDVEKDMPKVSETTDELLRVAITIETDNATYHGGGAPSTPDLAVFRIWLLDYTYSQNTGSFPSQFAHGTGRHSPQYIATKASHSSVVAKGSGFYEITAPSTYSGTSRKFTISFNADYCRALLRSRMGATLANANNLSGISGGVGHYSTTHADSIFPLGQRSRSEFGGVSTIRGPWYAPRVHVVDDLNFRCSTTITYTDEYLDLANEPMVIRGITWSQKERDHEVVKLSLERVASQYRYDLSSIIRGPGNEQGGPNDPRGRGQGGGQGGESPGNPAGSHSTKPGGSTPREDSQGPYTIRPLRPGVGGGDTSGGVMNLGVNALSGPIHRSIKGRMDVKNDNVGSGGQWGMPGQRKTGVAASHSRSVDGIDSVPSPTDGQAIMTIDGFTLPGVNDPELGAAGEKHVVRYDVSLPNDIADSFTTITAILSYDNVSGGGNAELTTKVECLETSKSASQTILIGAGSSRAQVTLFQPEGIEGGDTAGNTLRVTITRKPGQGNDAGLFQAVRIHSLAVKPRRYTQPSVGATDVFKPY